MILKNNIRKILFACMNQESIDTFYKIYYRIKYPQGMEKKCSYGEKNPGIVFYVIRPRIDGTEGLMSLFINVLRNLLYADSKGYVPVVDFKNYHTQYDDNINGETNSWNFYFTQPSNYTLEEVYSSKNVILSGLEIHWYRPMLLEKSMERENLKTLNDFVSKRIYFSDRVLNAVKSEEERLKIDYCTTIGLYLRGTDYIALRPSGHPIQPTAEQAESVVDEYIRKYGAEYIFLVTEDAYIYDSIKTKYGEACKIVSNDSFIKHYSGKKFLSHDKSVNELNQSPYVRGLNYLVKLIILSKCRYFVGGDTMGSHAANIFSGDGYKDAYMFNLGLYGK